MKVNCKELSLTIESPKRPKSNVDQVPRGEGASLVNIGRGRSVPDIRELHNNESNPSKATCESKVSPNQAMKFLNSKAYMKKSLDMPVV